MDEEQKKNIFEIMNIDGNYGCSCQAGCLQYIILLILLAIAAYMLISRFLMNQA